MEQNRALDVLLYFKKLAGVAFKIDIETVISLISNTTTEKELTITCQLDEKVYETGHKITDDELAQISIFPCETLGKWNYIIKPKN